MDPNATIATIHTPSFAHHNVCWSPFFPNRLALASSANYGLIGNGRLQVASLNPPQAPTLPVGGTSAGATVEKIFETQDAIYDLAWSEVHENQIVTAGGDGSIRLWDITLNDHPIRTWREHTKEVYSVDWNNINKSIFCSSSWDGSIRIWSPDRPHSIQSIPAHQACIYQAVWSPHQPDLLASCAADGTIRVFDLRSPSHLPYPAPSMTIQAHSGETLSVDWNKWTPYTLASGSTDRTVRIWDARMLSQGGGGNGEQQAKCVNELRGHEYAARKVAWSNFSGDLVASTGYDMTARIWNTSVPQGMPSLKCIFDRHTEFVLSCAWSLNEPGVIATSGWDCRTHIWRVPL